MKKTILALLLCAVMLLAACAQAEEIKTGIGNYTKTEEFMSEITANSGETVKAAAGNILLVVTLKPAEGVTVDLDQADTYFMSGTKATLDNQSYDLIGVVYERANAGDKVIKCRLVFEVKDNGYADSNQKPDVVLTLPSVP
jgi:ABC-type enterochelin transport system substrate-binding protein